MQKIVECVPNFSEGRDRKVIDAIAAAIAAVDGVELLDVDPGRATNRTVMTFAGPVDAAGEAAFQAIRTAQALIDMRKHTGAHPRQGATDVCPFIPVASVSMEECVELSRAVARRVGEELEIPVYLYERSATRPERTFLPDIRAGEYEALAGKLGKPEWRPDFGPGAFTERVARSGVTVMGAREFLIAYNVNLNTRDAKYASDIAVMLRESGYVKRGPSPTRFYTHGEILRDAAGKALKEEGRFKFVKAVGWYIEDFGVAQISINLTNYKETPIHQVYDECVRQAEARGLRVTGSEIVGLVPLEALLAAGRHYLAEQHKPAGAPPEELVHIAVRSLGLNDLYPFEPNKKIIEYRFRKELRLAGMKVSAFLDELSSDSMAPGGGSAAALCGALGAALAAMVANLTAAKREMFDRFDEMSDLAAQGQDLKASLLALVDEDTEAFNRIIAAGRMPKKSPEDKKARAAALQAASKHATQVPLRTAELCLEALRLAKAAAARGNPASVTDAGAAALAARAGFEGALLNVQVNLPSVEDEAFRREVAERTGAWRAAFAPLFEETMEAVKGRLAAGG